MRAGIVGTILVLGLGFAGCTATTEWWYSNCSSGLIDKSCDPATPLHEAAKAGDLPTATELVSKYPRAIADRDRYGGTALHVAVAFRQKDVAELLLAKGADVNDGRNRDAVTPLHIAAGNGDMDMAKLLLANGADVHAKNRVGETPLFVADCKHQTAVAALLRAHISKTENIALAQQRDRDKRSPC